MIAIVCGHISCVYFPTWLNNFWPVAFFFLVAGFFIKENNLQDPVKFIGHKLKTIYLPGTIIYIIAVLLHNPLCQWGVYPLGDVHPMTGNEFTLWDTKTYILQIVKTIFAPSGELAMGAMWFLYALFFALCFLSIIAYMVKKIVKDNKKQIILLSTLTCLLSTASIALKIYGIAIPRVSQALTVTTFIVVGMLLKQKMKIKCDNWMILIIAIVIYSQFVVLPHPHPSFPTNSFQNIIMPLAMGVASLYIVLFISRKIEKLNVLNRILSYIGRKSLYIMALHIFGFFICTWIINLLGIGDNFSMASSLYTYNVGGNIILGILYLIFGITIPLISIQLFRLVRSKVILINKRQII